MILPQPKKEFFVFYRPKDLQHWLSLSTALSIALINSAFGIESGWHAVHIYDKECCPAPRHCQWCKVVFKGGYIVKIIHKKEGEWSLTCGQEINLDDDPLHKWRVTPTPIPESNCNKEKAK